MDVHVSLDGRRDLARQMYRQIRAAILDGRLRPGDPLPPSRELAARLAVSRNTVSAAYDLLAAEGFVVGRVGVGTYVSEQVHARGRPGPAGAPRSGVGVPPRLRPLWNTQPDPPDLSAVEPEFDFRAGIPDAQHFPYGTWRALVADQLRTSSVHIGAYGDPAGHPGLRAAIARHVGLARAVHATADDVLVTSGFQQAIDLIGRVLLEPGDVVAIEDPGYPPVRRLFESMGARVVGVPVDSDGLVVDALPEGVRLVYVSPSHQFPLGLSMSLPRRLALLSRAEHTGAVIVEDDYDSEFRYTGRPIEPLQSLDRSDRVCYVGSFSKTMLPTLRLGFCVAPPALYPALRKAKYVVDWHTPLPMQAALARFIDEGLFARHVRRMRNVYRARRDRIVVTLDRDFADLLEPISSAAGLHLAAWLSSGTAADADAVTRRARAAGVDVASLSGYAVTNPARAGLILGYGIIPTERIDEGLTRLRRCFGP